MKYIVWLRNGVHGTVTLAMESFSIIIILAVILIQRTDSSSFCTHTRGYDTTRRKVTHVATQTIDRMRGGGTQDITK